MDWTQTRRDYYLDFVLVPLLVTAVLVDSVFYHGRFGLHAAGAAAGLVLWTFIEYWIHRSLFHHVFRRGHGLHHRRPEGYVAAPTWLTGIAHIGTLLPPLALGHPLGIGIWAGLELGYMSYIIVHDRIHHGATVPGGWVDRRRMLHMMHHRGAHVNFGVVTNVWDRVFNTFRGLTF